MPTDISWGIVYLLVRFTGPLFTNKSPPHTQIFSFWLVQQYRPKFSPRKKCVPRVVSRSVCKGLGPCARQLSPPLSSEARDALEAGEAFPLPLSVARPLSASAPTAFVTNSSRPQSRTKPLVGTHQRPLPFDCVPVQDPQEVIFLGLVAMEPC